MAALASLTLGLRMQARQLARLVTAAADGRLRDAARAVCAVARQATDSQLAMRRAAFFGMARGARLCVGAPVCGWWQLVQT